MTQHIEHKTQSLSPDIPHSRPLAFLSQLFLFMQTCQPNLTSATAQVPTVISGLLPDLLSEFFLLCNLVPTPGASAGLS